MSNFLAWNLQIAIVAAAAAFVPWIVRLRMPAARLFFWQAVLAASLALPVLRPWRSVPGDGLVTITSRGDPSRNISRSAGVDTGSDSVPRALPHPPARLALHHG